MGDQWPVASARTGRHEDADDGTRQERPARRDRRRDARLVAGGLTLVLLVWFAVANLQEVRIRFWVTQTAAPLVVVVVISAMLGAGASALWTRRRRRRARRLGRG